MNGMMHAMEVAGDRVAMIEIPTPIPGKGEVRVKVITAAVNAAEKIVISGSFVGRFLHAKTSPLVLGWDFAGIIDSIGEGVTDMAEGTSVWGHLPYSMFTKQGTFAQYVTLPYPTLAVKPDDVPYHVAAAAATVSMTSLQSLRDHGRLQEGGKLMIIGAGGGIGSVSIGIGKRLGVHVTAVC
ncbi:MAG: alcohol dehydrogenase catalytic domain-containing protein, partial [Saprospiraceae bacterium]|nr:alcohol dehydrogenase catalytic domain-containing protein [Saprospiraceae bacterium]